jgi:peptidoglycan/LPS O-acetylase OafA/YrhL
VAPKYRADIDGLRAIAVISVLLFHAKVGPFTGGYVGVDVFFVISGYLITSIIIREMRNGTFSYGDFYERRFRRIVPALAVVVLVSGIAGLLIFDAESLVDLGESIAANAIFSSNMLFHSESGYFDGPAELKPLLHTWSLAIEEQFYIFIPIVLMFALRSGQNKLNRYLLVITVLSFALNIIGMNYNVSATFYLLPMRAWELLLGSLLALSLLPQLTSSTSRNVISCCGLAAIFCSVLLFSPETSFPGIAAVLPTAGAALIIYSGMHGVSLVGRMLSLKPIVFIGLISYSLYLWHWPILLFFKAYSITEISLNQTLGLMVFILGISILSYHYIEKPFRRKTLLSNRQSVMRATSATSVVALLIGSIFIFTGGLPHRFESTYSPAEIAGDPEWERWGLCEKMSRQGEGGGDFCLIGTPDVPPTFFFWGDSHARALATGLELSARNSSKSGEIAVRNGCPPLLGVVRLGEEKKGCGEFNEKVMRYISESKNIDMVILSARWTISALGTRYKNESGERVRLVDLNTGDLLSSSNVEIFEIALKRTVQLLLDEGKRVVLVNTVPEIGYNVPSVNIVAMLTGRNISLVVGPSASELKARAYPVDMVFSDYRNDERISIVNPAEYLCSKEMCSVAVDNIPLYRDDDHLSTYGSRYVSSVFDFLFL